MANFDQAFIFTVSIEEGFVNNSSDRGGPTKYGITQATLADYRGQPVFPEEVKDLQISEAKEIYKKNYWDKHRLGEVQDDTLALFLFDQGVNRGPKHSIMTIQSIVGANPDGIMGEETLGLLNNSSEEALHLMQKKFFEESQISYARIVQSDTTQAVNLVGWLRRTHKLFEVLG